MARPMKFDRDQAVEVVMNEIWRNGYEAASVKALSEKLAITRSSFYNSFGRREDLFKEAMHHYATTTPDCALYEMDRSRSLKDVVTTLFREICRQRSADPEHRGCLATNCAAELLPGAGELADFMTVMLGQSRGMVEEKVRWAVEDGELPAVTDPAAFALAVQNLMLGVNLQSKIVHDEAALWASCQPALAALGLLSEQA